MKIADLVNRFKFYAINHVDIRHVESDQKKHSFFHLEGEELQKAVQNGIKLPCLLLQTPDMDKTGDFDNLAESTSFTFVVLNKIGNSTKSQILDACKTISDDIFNLLCEDFITDVLPGALENTSEGMAGPLANNLYGWGVSMVINDAYDAEVKRDKWLHLSEPGI